RSHRWPSNLEASIEPAILYCLGDVLRADRGGACKIGDRARYAQHPVVCPCGQQEAGQRMAQQLARLAARSAVPGDLARTDQGVRLTLAQELDLAGMCDARRHGGGRLARRRREELALPRRGNFQLDVDTIGERTGDAAAVSRDPLGRTAAAAAAIAAMA